MKSNIDRRREIFTGAIPNHGSPEYEKVVTYLSNRPQSPKHKKFLKDCFKKAKSSLEAQYHSSCNFVTEDSLRHFLMEFNSRAWNHGLRSMPLMFNIIESFFNYRKPHIYFELIEEENYLFSLFDFLEFLSSSNFNDQKSLIEENFDEDIIYNVNVGDKIDEITFQVDENLEFVIAGLSLIRRGDEVTILMTTGCNSAEHVSNKDINFDSDNPNKASLIKEMIAENSNSTQEPIFIDEDKNYAKVLVACRFDLENNSIDARYVAQEYEKIFRVNTDEIDGFLDKNGEYSSDDYIEIHKNGIKLVESYNALFEFAKSALLIPYYLNTFEENLIEEIHETDFKKIISSPIKKRKFKDTFGRIASTKSLYILNNDNKFSPDLIKYRDDLFHVETSGYWRKLDIDEVGQDKKGNAIHGKTWVNKKLSYFRSKTDELVIQKEKKEFNGTNSGYIYIMRNPTMQNNIFKIGLTRKDVDDRAKQLSKTSVPDKFYKSQEWQVFDCIIAEKEIHEELQSYRVDPRREFFEIEYSKAIEVIGKICDKINKNAA